MSCSTQSTRQTVNATASAASLAHILDSLRIDATGALCSVLIFVSRSSLLPYRPDLNGEAPFLRAVEMHEFDGAIVLLVEGEDSPVILRLGTVLDWQFQIV